MLNQDLKMADISFGTVFQRKSERKPEIERVLIDRNNPLETLSEQQIFRRYRFRRNGIMFITSQVEALKRPTLRNMPLTPLFQILITLRFLATGSFYTMVGDAMPRVSASSVCRVVWGVVDSLFTLFHQFVFVTRPRNIPAIKQQFYSIAGKDIVYITILSKSLHF